MSDVARAAGVSVMTVSNAINGRPRVSAETRLRVLEVVAELGYEVNLSARHLRAGRSDTVALIVPAHGHAYFGELGARFAKHAATSGLHLVVEQSGASREGELSALSTARMQMYDGVLLSSVGLRYRDLDRLRTNVPVVLLGEQPMPTRYDHVHMDNVGGGRIATEHLLGQGAERVLLVGGTDDPKNEGMPRQRALGWREAHKARGLDVDPALMVELRWHDSDEAEAVLGEYLRTGPSFDAVFAVTDQVALGVLAALRGAQVAVPDQVMVVGFDNLELARYVGPGLSSVDPSPDWIAENAWRILQERMRGSDAPPEQLMAPARLVQRASSARPQGAT